MPTSDRESQSPSQYSEGSYDSYSDESFDSDEESRKGRSAKLKRTTPRSSTTQVRRSNTKTLTKKGRTSKASKAGGGGNTPRNAADNVTRRMLSARRMKINELKNEVDELVQTLDELRTENKIIKRQKAIQDRQLDRYEGQEGEMPQVIMRHTEEVRTVREQLKRQKNKAAQVEKKHRDANEELNRTQRQLKKALGVINEKGLGERHELARKLKKSERDREEKEKRVMDLERHVENLQKNHRHELGIERARHRESQKKVQELELSLEKLQQQVREKDKELEVRNIYANRLMKPPHRLSSTRSTPAPSLLSGRGDRKHSDPLALTNGEKESSRKLKSLSSQSQYSRAQQKRAQRAWSTRQATKREAEEEEIRLEELQREREKREQEIRREQEEWEERRRQMQREEEEWEEERRLSRRHQQEEQAQRDREEQEKLEHERREKEGKMAEEQRRQEEEEQRAELRRRQEEERMEQEEQEGLKRQVRERKEREERDRMLEAQRKAVAEADQERQRQKELLLAKMKAIDEVNGGAKPGKSPSPSESPSRQRRNYTFTKPIENLHNGKPSYDPTGSVPVVEKNRRRGSLVDSDEELTFGGYAPTFNSKPTNNKRPSFLSDNVDIKPKNAAAAKKQNLMADLFGSSSTSKMDSADEDHFSSPSKPVVVARCTSGANDPFSDRSSSPGSLLPRRGRQSSSTLSSKPAINAIDIIEDDLEEVVL